MYLAAVKPSMSAYDRAAKGKRYSWLVVCSNSVQIKDGPGLYVQTPFQTEIQRQHFKWSVTHTVLII